jgi:hypothetical protein
VHKRALPCTVGGEEKFTMMERQDRERALRAERASLTENLAGMPWRLYTVSEIERFEERYIAYRIARGRGHGVRCRC